MQSIAVAESRHSHNGGDFVFSWTIVASRTLVSKQAIRLWRLPFGQSRLGSINVS
ncbi:hypothetical protein [Brasilonema bromeliae]|uniref:hypothetical protein n=1 Tax=Brasilonema bromeliae TaxID=383615 RepID=UPI00145F4A7A